MLIASVLIINGCKNDDNSLNYNGFTYTTVNIGTQQWTVENLRTTAYNDGTAISRVTDSLEWKNLKTGAFCSYNNDETNSKTYGYLYNWYSVNSGKLAPTNGGWRVPTYDDWKYLIEYVGGKSNAGMKLKAKSGWYENGNGTDEFGFSALPGGNRNYDISFEGIGDFGLWWGSTPKDSEFATYIYMAYNQPHIARGQTNKELGFSVRFVRDK